MVWEEEGNEERKNRGRKGNLKKKKVSLILLSHNSVSCHMREIYGPCSVQGEATQQHGTGASQNHAQLAQPATVTPHVSGETLSHPLFLSCEV